MNGPKDGSYHILPSFLMQPSPGIGADPAPPIPGAASPVVFKGEYQVWLVQQLPDGSYTLTLEGGGKSTADPERNVWVNNSIPVGEIFQIVPLPDCDFYLIKSGNLTWTLPSPEDKTPVVLRSAEEPYDFQQWIFRRVIMD